MTHRIEQLSEDVTLYLGDCRDIMPTLGKVDAVVTDPPYGINACKGVGRENRGLVRRQSLLMRRGGAKWDERAPSDIVQSLLGYGKWQIIWGGNYFALPPSRGFLVWNKGLTLRGRSHAEAEIAWCSMSMNARVIDIEATSCHRDTGREHPTQKPVSLMRWCLGFLPDARTILDPFMGSGTTGVACVQLGRKFIGIELEPSYFDIACRRISDELKRPRLALDVPRHQPKQESFI